MSIISQEEFAKLAHLCKLHCSEEEQKIISVNISKILSHAKELEKLDTKEVEPYCQSSSSGEGFLREDLIGQTLSRKDFLANAPEHTGGMIRVPSVLQK
jgi:aspartyl-tRNA(Asn)/glutamyl-tRNA(Gln) amidotransferase subunit C